MTKICQNLFTTGILFFLLLFLAFSFSSEKAIAEENENLDNLPLKETRQFKAKIAGILCKPCLKALIDEIKSNKGIKKTGIKSQFAKNKDKRKQAHLYVVYDNPPVSKEILIEIIRFRDLTIFDIEDNPE